MANKKKRRLRSNRVPRSTGTDSASNLPPGMGPITTARADKPQTLGHMGPGMDADKAKLAARAKKLHNEVEPEEPEAEASETP